MARLRITTLLIFYGILPLVGCGFTEYKNLPTSSGATQGGGSSPITNIPDQPVTPSSSPTPAPTTVPTPVPSPTNTGISTVKFSQINTQILQPKCLQCHGSGSRPDFSSYSSFATNSAYIVPGNPGSSSLYTVVQNGSMPQGGPPLSSAQVQEIFDWIQEGAQNN